MQGFLPIGVEAAEEQAVELLAMELDSLIRVLEAQLPVNPASSEAERIENGLVRVFKEYFKALEKALPMDDIIAHYYREVGNA